MAPYSIGLAVASWAGVYICDSKTLEEERFLETDAPAQWVAYSPDGRTLAAAVGQGMVQFWDVESGQVQNSLHVGDAEQEGIYVTSLAFSPDSRLLAWGGFNCQVHLFDVESARGMRRFQQDTYLDAENVQVVAFSPDGRHVAADSAHGMWLWEVESGELQFSGVKSKDRDALL